MARLETENLREFDPNVLPSGCRIPRYIFDHLFQQKRIPPIGMEMGAGKGNTAKWLRQTHGAFILTSDINPKAVEIQEKNGLLGVVSDARKIQIDDWNGISFYLEYFPLIYMEGLLCNQKGKDINNVITSAWSFLSPGGHLLIADIRNAASANTAFSNLENHQQLIHDWYKRYKKNQEAFNLLGLKLPPDHFMVFKPGEYKYREWGSPQDLVRGFNDPEVFERIARHLGPNSIKKIIRKLPGLEIVEELDEVFYSRTGPLNGWVLHMVKGPRYQLYPWYKDMTKNQRQNYQDIRRFESRANPRYWDDYRNRLVKNFNQARINKDLTKDIIQSLNFN